MSKIINEYNYFNKKNKLRNYYIDNITDINIIKEELIQLKFENTNLKNQQYSINNLKKELKEAKDKIKLLQMKIEQLIKENDEQKKKYNLEIENIINERDFQQINFNKRMTIFDQKLNKVHDIEMENEVYKDELNTLKDKNKKLEESVNLKKTELEINNKIKFNQIKNKVINDLKETKKNMLSLNLENMDIQN